jgi:23S rRNA pseudouridine2605 synthase
MSNRRPQKSKGPRSSSSPPSNRPRHGSGSHAPLLDRTRGNRRNDRSRYEDRANLPGRAVSVADEAAKPERLQKILARAGLGSRRACEELILKGRVAVDGQVVRQLGTRVDAASARITVDGEPVRSETKVYFAVNKPKGYVSTNSDPSGRPRVVDLLPEIPERVYTVGRLDEDSTGLLILTNDGELANKLAHPRYGVEKIYRALVAGLPAPEMITRLTEGVWLSDGKVRAKRARVVGRQGQATQLELVLAEGKKREIRRMLAKLGHKVMSLARIAIGPVSLKGLGSGECRPLSRHEVDLLRKVASGVAVTAPRTSEDEFPRAPQRPLAHGSKQSHRNKPGRSNHKRGAMRHGSAERRYRDDAVPEGAKAAKLNRQQVPRSDDALGSDQPGARQKKSGSVRGLPAQPQAAGTTRPAIKAVLPPTQSNRSRRIIGLEPEPSATRRDGPRRRPLPKRPTARKPRPRLIRPEPKSAQALANGVEENEGKDD